MTEAPKEIWAWYFTPSKQDDVIKGGWDDAPDHKCTHYTRTDTIPTWQPIETAPKDGEYLLLRAGNFPPVVARWDGSTWDAFDEARFAYGIQGHPEGYEYSPTLWMPILPAPEEG